MACPYFHAVSPRNQTDHSRSAMLPLGDAWDGVCLAPAASPAPPDEVTLLTRCNMGYARGCCPRFPADDGPDAARFTISSDSAETLRLYFVLERDHLPWAHGPLEYSRKSDTFTAPSASESTLQLARAYVASYLRRISEASRH
jgi:hypothetical protein